MAHLRNLAFISSLVASPAWADVARPTPVVQATGWPSWAVVLVTFTLFIGLIAFISRFFRDGGGGTNNKDDGGILGS